MRLLVGLFFILYAHIGLQAQSGFIQSYDYEERGLSFHYMLLADDTIVICGSITHPELPKWGLFFAKLDTLGNILDYKTHYDSIGHSYVFESGAKMIKTSDGGYAMVGSNFTNKNRVIFKLDINGNKEFIKEYPDPIPMTFSKRHTDIIEIENGYISIGRKQQMDDGLNDAFAICIDKQGNKIWELNYGETGVSDSFGTIMKKSDNEFIIFGGTGIQTPTVNPIENAWARNRILTIDSLGNVLSVLESDEYLITEGLSNSLRGIQFDEEGSSVSLNTIHNVDIVLGEPTLLSQPTLIGRDQDYNILWHTSFKDASNTAGKNRFNALVQTPDNGWVAVGSYFNILDYNIYEGYQTGMIAKVNANGDSLWSRIDTIFTPAWGSRPKLSSVVALPSGSIIACGQVDRYTPEPAKSFGWIVKVDKNGCIESDCNMTNSTEIFPNIGNFEVFPNPTEDIIWVRGEGEFDVVVYGVGGKQYLDLKNINRETSLDLSNLTRGIFFLQIRKGNQFLTKKIVKN